MAHAYTPGLKVAEQTTLRVRRMLPISGEVHVSVGDRVDAQKVVAAASIPGNIYPINISNQLGIAPAEIKECLFKQEGEQIVAGEDLAQSKGIFGFFKKTLASKSTGTIESISKITGQVIIRGEPIPVQVRAYVPGKVVEVMPGQGVAIDSQVTFVQGIFGIGGEAYGDICLACNNPQQSLTADLITKDMQGQIVIGGARMTHEAVEKAISVGANAVVSGGIDDQDLKTILGYDLGVAITGTEQIGTTLIVTEGFGDIGMAQRTFDLFHKRAGSPASVNGATQIRAGVMRPEIVIPIASDSSSEVFEEGVVEGVLEPGTLVRIIRDPFFGRIGTVDALPSEPQVLGSGSKARVLDVETEEGLITVPRANVEIIAG